MSLLCLVTMVTARDKLNNYLNQVVWTKLEFPGLNIAEGWDCLAHQTTPTPTPKASSYEGLWVTVSLSVSGSNCLPEVWSRVHTASSVWHLLHFRILSFDLSALYLVASATPQLKDFLTQAKGGDIRIVKIVIKNGKGS